MKFYIASRTAKIKEVQSMIVALEDLGHEITHDWTAADSADLARPYRDHLEKVVPFAINDVNGAATADVFIILSDESGTGMYVEFGAALAGGAKIYSVGDFNEVTVFHFHPNVRRVATFDDVLIDLGLR